jgi:16S rRNA (guanine966-N2)-methyltransferase
MSLKILGGEHRGRVLQSVRGMGTRPLLGQVREALFNILAEAVPGAMVWDLFAGSGASGLEALSRGADRVLFVEKNGRALDVLQRNLQLLGADTAARGRPIRGDAWEPPMLDRAAYGLPAGDAAPGQELAPDLVFLDPPYDLVAEDPAKSLVRAMRLLDRTADRGCVIFHFETGVLDADDFGEDLDVDLREWGRTAIALLWRKGQAPEHLQRRWAKARLRRATDDAD